jgi:hypothetical protein
MKSKNPVLLMLIGALLVPTFAFAAASAPAGAATPPAAVQAPALMSPLSPESAACSNAIQLPLLPLLPLAGDLGGICGPCSAKACVGLPELGTCGSGLRCIPQGTCSATHTPKCNCLII